MTKEEYNLVLFELGLLTDDEDWELYQKQELRYDLDLETWVSYNGYYRALPTLG